MEIKILNDGQLRLYEQELLQLLTDGDEEFLPPLSARSSTTQSDWTDAGKGSGGVLAYFEELKKQRLLVATEEGHLIGFVSFKENYVNDQIAAEELPNLYISTVLVSPRGRGKGLTQKMYEVLFREYERSHLFTRTWSTNAAHIRILSKLDFEVYRVLKDHRGDGIDTVYFKRGATK